ncbi:hypothetical protein [Acidocella sp.]|uniref:hypothetical protein n=1 Tax=Acidocella sp. TaxID=50710 RepID=UPI002F3F087A
MVSEPTRGERNNNPFDIEVNPRFKWLGQTGQDGPFCTFDTIEHGLRAGFLDIWNAWKEGYNSPAKFAHHYAPEADGNDTAAYAVKIADVAGCRIGDEVWPISRDFLVRVACACLLMEQGHIAYTQRQLYQAAIDAEPWLPSVEGTDGYGNPLPT